MQTAKDLAPTRKEPQPRATDSNTPKSFKLDGKPVAATDSNDAPVWDEV
jgi:hypothetical protein